MVYHRQWLSIITRDDILIFMDFVPGPKGNLGQLIMQVTECSYQVVGTSLFDFLKRWIAICGAWRCDL